MRDNFYHFLIVALLNTMFFGSEVARMADGTNASWANIGMSALISTFAIAGAVLHYRKAIATPKLQEQS